MWAAAPRRDIPLDQWLFWDPKKRSSLDAESEAERIAFLREFNDGCRVSLRQHKNRELIDLYGADVVASYAAADTSHTRWADMVEAYCHKSPSLACDGENRLRSRDAVDYPSPNPNPNPNP